jgi:RHS repeat-associated protein
MRHSALAKNSSQPEMKFILNFSFSENTFVSNCTEVYSYQFNGKEKDGEFTEGSFDFGARVYECRLGRWMSLDPLMEKYPSFSPFGYVNSNPVLFVDHDGRDIIIYYKEKVTEENGTVTMVDKSYQYGSGLPVPQNEFVQTTVEALDYAVQNDPNAVVSNLKTSSTITWNIKEATGTNPEVDDATAVSETHDADGNITHVTGTTAWNPNVGLLTTNGGALSASTILYHEGSHVFSLGSQPTIDDYIYQLQEVGVDLAKDYDVNNDQVVIGDYENTYVENVNKNEAAKYNAALVKPEKSLQVQGVRRDHRGTFYYTNGVNSIEPGPGMAPGQGPGGELRGNSNVVDVLGKEHTVTGIPQKTEN